MNLNKCTRHRSLLQFGWETHSQTYHIPKPRTPPDPQHTCRTGGSQVSLQNQKPALNPSTVLINIFSIQANTPHTHEISRLFPWEVVRAESDHPPEVVLLLSSAQAANGETRNIPFSHFCSTRDKISKA